MTRVDGILPIANVLPLTEVDLETHSRLCLPLVTLNNGVCSNTSCYSLLCIYLPSAQGQFNYQDRILTHASSEASYHRRQPTAVFPQLLGSSFKRTREGLQANIHRHGARPSRNMATNPSRGNGDG